MKLTIIVAIAVVLISHCLFFSSGVKIDIKWKILKDRRGLARDIMPLALSSVEGKG